MTKEKVLAQIGEKLPDGAEVLAYHISIKTEKGQNSFGKITARSDELLLHMGSIQNHVAEALGVSAATVAVVAEQMFVERKKRKKITAEATTARMEVPDDDK